MIYGLLYSSLAEIRQGRYFWENETSQMCGTLFHITFWFAHMPGCFLPKPICYFAELLSKLFYYLLQN